MRCTLNNILLAFLALSHSSTISAQSTASTFTTLSTSTTSPTTTSTSTSTTSTTTSTSTSTPRPIYAIAHRVLTTTSLTAALSHGANALEIDLTAHTYGWYSDHDNTLCSARSPAASLFSSIADARRSGSPISFVWLDIKNPDECDEGRACSIEALRDLAREVLGGAGVGVLYGFYAQEESRGFRVISEDLKEGEAVVLSGDVSEVEGWFDALGDDDTVCAKRKVMDYGAVDLTEENFGSCDDDSGVCAVLKEGTAARDNGDIGAVMAWTTDEGEGWMVKKILGEAGVDGIIYGFGGAEYADDESVLAAYLDIEEYVAANGDTMRMAKGGDLPW